ncbi:MAG TPA: hypothetical protein VF178_04825 [Gemmatimonadaceae bacterium]
MIAIIRSLLAVSIGTIAGWVVIFLVQNISSGMYSLPAGVDVSTPEALARAMSLLPIGAFLMVLLSYAAGSAVGGAVAARIAPRARIGHAVVVGLLLTLVGLINLSYFRHPTWFIVVNVPEFVVFAWLGAVVATRLGRASRPPGPDQPDTAFEGV